MTNVTEGMQEGEAEREVRKHRAETGRYKEGDKYSLPALHVLL